MFNAKTFLRHATLALALACSSLAAMAGPVAFHVNIDTTGRSGPGFLDLMFSTSSSTLVTATVRNFTSPVGDVVAIEQVSENPDGSFGLANLPDLGSYLKFGMGLGGAFGFDVFFSDDQALDAGNGGSTLSIGLRDASGVLGEDDGIVKITLKQGTGAFREFTNAEFAQVDEIAAAVPEPSDWLLMATGLALLGARLRRRTPR